MQIGYHLIIIIDLTNKYIQIEIAYQLIFLVRKHWESYGLELKSDNIHTYKRVNINGADHLIWDSEGLLTPKSR